MSDIAYSPGNNRRSGARNPGPDHERRAQSTRQNGAESWRQELQSNDSLTDRGVIEETRKGARAIILTLFGRGVEESQVVARFSSFAIAVEMMMQSGGGAVRRKAARSGSTACLMTKLIAWRWNPLQDNEQ